MSRFDVGDRIRIDIPDETDFDHERYHGREGTIVEILRDDIAEITGDERDQVLYRVELENDGQVDLRRRDLRPAFKQ